MLTTTEDENHNNEGKWIPITILIIIFVWTILGLAGFIWSIVCFTKNNKTSLNVLGFLLAVLFGPFYWIYFIFNKSYCRKTLE